MSDNNSSAFLSAKVKCGQIPPCKRIFVLNKVPQKLYKRQLFILNRVEIRICFLRFQNNFCQFVNFNKLVSFQDSCYYYSRVSSTPFPLDFLFDLHFKLVSFIYLYLKPKFTSLSILKIILGEARDILLSLDRVD